MASAPTAIGLDLGADYTVGAVVTEDGPTVLDVSPVPTGLVVTDEGIGLPDTLAERAISVLPHQRTDDPGDSDGQLPLTVFFSALATRWELPTDVPLVLSVSGSYTGQDRQQLERAAHAAGFETVLVYRRPLGLAADRVLAAPTPTPRTTVAVAVDADETALAALTVTEDDQLRMQAHQTVPVGREDIDRALADWLLAERADELGVTVEYGPETTARLTDRAHSTLAAITSATRGDDARTVEVTPAEDLMVTDGALVDTPIAGTVSVEFSALHRALREPVGELRGAVADLLDSAALDVAAVDDLLIGGHESDVPYLRRAIDDLFDVTPAETLTDDPQTAGVVGAAVLGDAHRTGDALVAGTTTAGAIELTALGADGPASRTIIPAGQPSGATGTITLQLAPDEQAGVIMLSASTPRTTTQLGTYTIDPIPDDSLTVTATIRADAGEDAIDLLAGDSGVTFTVDLAATANGEALSITPTDHGLPWLAFEDVAPDTLPDPTRELDRDGDATRIEPRQAAIDAVDTEDFVEAVHRTRNKLWERVETEQSLAPEEIGILLREFDSTLALLDATVIDPEIGTAVDPSRHEVRATEPSDDPTGTIITVERPGLVLDGVVLQPARVVVAD